MIRLAGWVALCLAAGCTASSDTPTEPDWSSGHQGQNTDTGPATDSGSGTTTDTDTNLSNFALSIPTGLPVLGRLHKTGATDACQLTLDSTPAGYQEVDCTLDIPELDLWGYGLNYTFEVGANTCDFVVWQDYMYEQWQVGVGPTQVDYTEDSFGNITDGPNTINGRPACHEFDYSLRDPTYPDCCIGSYTLTEHFSDGVTPDKVAIDQYWPGYPSACYGGTAYLDPTLGRDVEGYPEGVIVALDSRTPFVEQFTMPELSATKFSNIPYANYYDLADLGGQLPVGLRPVDPSLGIPDPRPQTTFYCYDHAMETLGEIHLTVREWNELSQYLVDGDPDTTGVEPNQTNGPLDDIWDWKDFADYCTNDLHDPAHYLENYE